MKKKKAGPLTLAAEVAIVTLYSLSKKCIEKQQPAGASSALSDKKFQRKMTVLATIYHFIGVFYNE